MTGIRTLFASLSFRLCLVVWSFGYILVDLSAMAQGRSAPGVMFLTNLPLLALGVALSLGLSQLMRRTAAQHALVRWAVLALAIVAAGVVQTAVDHYWLSALALTVLPSWKTWALNADPRSLSIVYMLYTWTLALSAALIWSVRANDAAKLNEARAAAFESAALRAEAAALRLQLNPHFLFNTLNGIASLVVGGRKQQAEEMIGRLADFLRSSLAADPTALIPLSQELTTVRSYLHIEEARFGDRMQVLYALEGDTMNVSVPNFLLQPLIENAVKYGVSKARKGAIIEVSAAMRDGYLVLAVENREFGAESRVDPGEQGGPRPSYGLGLANTRRRLKSLYGDRAWVATHTLPRGYYCEVGLPAAVEAAQPVVVAA